MVHLQKGAPVFARGYVKPNKVGRGLALDFVIKGPHVTGKLMET